MQLIFISNIVWLEHMFGDSTCQHFASYKFLSGGSPSHVVEVTDMYGPLFYTYIQYFYFNISICMHVPLLRKTLVRLKTLAAWHITNSAGQDKQVQEPVLREEWGVHRYLEFGPGNLWLGSLCDCISLCCKFGLMEGLTVNHLTRKSSNMTCLCGTGNAKNS